MSHCGVKFLVTVEVFFRVEALLIATQQYDKYVVVSGVELRPRVMRALAFIKSLSLTDLGGCLLHPPWPKTFSIPCSFLEHLANSYVGAPPGGSEPPPMGNPRSAPVYGKRW